MYNNFIHVLAIELVIFVINTRNNFSRPFSHDQFRCQKIVPSPYIIQVKNRVIENR